LGMNCDGSMEKFAGSLNASCGIASTCPNTCNTAAMNRREAPNAVAALPTKDCSFKCPAGLQLFAPTTKWQMAMAIPDAACISSGSYSASSMAGDVSAIDQIGCYACPVPDGAIGSTTPPPMVKSCLATCPSGFKLLWKYTVGNPTVNTVPGGILYGLIATSVGSQWLDGNHDLVGGSSMAYYCNPN
ncbi:hypothetical protein PENTCL1PPCAC_20222, partial [Pristionchus entomophagus]